MDQKSTPNLEEILRVNQAGEYGARQIYAGQLRTVKCEKQRKIIAHMAEQEEEHLQKFNELIIKHNVRPTVLQPLWHVGGYMMGAISGALGDDAAHACTIAVEEVIDDHYEEQLQHLKQNPDDNAELIQIIEKFQADEQEHKDIAANNGGEHFKHYTTLTSVVRNITKFAIAASKKI